MQKSSRSLPKTVVPRRNTELPTKAHYGDSASLWRLLFDADSLFEGLSRYFTSVAGVRQVPFVPATADKLQKNQNSQRTRSRVHTQHCKAMARTCESNWQNSFEPGNRLYRLTKIHPYKDASPLVGYRQYAEGCCSKNVASGVLRGKRRYHWRATIGWTSEGQVSWLSPTFSTRVPSHLLLPARSLEKAMSDHGTERFRRVRGFHHVRRKSIGDRSRLVPDDIGACTPRGQKSDSADKISALGLPRNLHVVATGGKPTTAEVVERRSAARAERKLSLNNDEKTRTSYLDTNWTENDLEKKCFSSVCSASSQTSEKYSAECSNPHNEYSVQDRAVKEGAFLLRTLPQSLTEAEKWEPSKLVLKQKQQVVQWKHSKICVVCKKEVQAGALDKVESACEKAWRFISGYARSHRVCPLLTNMRLMQYAEAPLKDRVRFDARLRRDEPVRAITT